MAIGELGTYPHATGAAAAVVSKHEEAQDLVFWSGWFCPYVQRAWIVLEERGIPYQYKEVNPYKKEQHFLDINPKGLVPAVEYKGRALYESLVICEFLEEAYPEHKPSLLPSDPVERAYARIWIDFIAKSVIPAFMRLMMTQEPDKQQEALGEFVKALATLAEKIQGPFFLGEQFSLVDVAVAPWVMRDYVIAENRGFHREAVGPKWKQYAETIEARDSVKSVMSEREKYADIYARYLKNEANSVAGIAFRAGRPLQ